MSEGKRDAAADLALCRAARTLEEWAEGHDSFTVHAGDGPWLGRFLVVAEDGTVFAVVEDEPWLDGEALARLFAAANKALPHWIAEAQRLDAEVARLQAENAEMLGLLADRVLDSDLAAHAVRQERDRCFRIAESEKDDALARWRKVNADPAAMASDEDKPLGAYDAATRILAGIAHGDGAWKEDKA